MSEAHDAEAPLATEALAPQEVFSLAAAVRRKRESSPGGIRVRLVDHLQIGGPQPGSPFAGVPEIVTLPSPDAQAASAALRGDRDLQIAWPEEHEPAAGALVDLIRALRELRPAARIDIAPARSERTLERLFEAGARGVLGGLPSGDWTAVLERHRRAQVIGFETDVCLPFGTCVATDLTAERLAALAELQHETGRLRTVTPYPVGAPDAPRDAVTTSVEDLVCIAKARLHLPLETRVRADWPTLTPRGAQLAFNFGADEILGLAGPETPPGTEDRPASLTRGRIERLITGAGLEIER